MKMTRSSGLLFTFTVFPLLFIFVAKIQCSQLIDKLNKRQPFFVSVTSTLNERNDNEKIKFPSSLTPSISKDDHHSGN